MLNKLTSIFLYAFAALAIITGVFYFYPELMPEYLEPYLTRGTTKVIPPPHQYQAKIESDKEMAQQPEQNYPEVDCNSPMKNDFVSGMLSQTNQARIAESQETFSWSTKLCQSALIKAQDIAEQGYFSHISPDGTIPTDIIEGVGYDFSFSGENLALNFYTAQTAHNALMNSPGHRENILSEDFEEIGIAYAEGTIQGKPGFIVVQHFGTPMPDAPLVRYVCDYKSAQSNINQLEDALDTIKNYLSDALETKEQLQEANQSTKEADMYIDDLKEKQSEYMSFLKEAQDYLKRCQKLEATQIK